MIISYDKKRVAQPDALASDPANPDALLSRSLCSVCLTIDPAHH